MKPPLFALLALIASPFLTHAQKVEWKGHIYEVIWFPEDKIDPSKFPNGFYGDGTSRAEPNSNPTTLGGHLLTITSEEEYQVVHGLWKEITKNPRYSSAPYSPLGLRPNGDESNETFEGYLWVTGEPYTYKGLLDEALHEYCEVVLLGNEQRVGAGGLKCNDTNYYFYILEKDPIDSDKDGVSDLVENREGTNPNDPSSIPTVAAAINPAVQLQTETQADKTYQVQISSDLKTWQNLETRFVGTGNPHSFYHLAGETAQFVRVLVVE